MQQKQNAAWSAALSVIFCGITIAILQNKVVPCLDAIQREFSIGNTTAGLLSSIFSVMGIAMAFPAAMIVNRFGVKKTCFFSLLSGTLGVLLGMTAQNVALLIFSRVLEGVGAGLISIAAPMTISSWFPPEKQGFPLGIWASWQLVAQALCFVAGAPLTERFGWRGVWRLSLLFLAAAAVLCVLFVRTPPQLSASEPKPEHQSRQALRTSSVWAISLSMLCFCTACFGFVTWISQCWTEKVGVSLAEANRYISLFAVISIPVVAGTGLLLDHIDHKKFCTFALLGYAVTTCTLFLLTTRRQLTLCAFIYPVLEGAASACLWAIVPQSVRRPEDTATAMALFNLCSNVGMLIGPPLAGRMIELAGWNGVIGVVAVSLVLAAIAARMVRDQEASGSNPDAPTKSG